MVALVIAAPAAIAVFAFTLGLPGVVEDGQEYGVRVSDGRTFGLALLGGALAVAGLALAAYRFEARRPITDDARARLARWAGIALTAVLIGSVVAAGIRARAFADWVERQADEFANPPTLLVTQEAERLTSISSNNRWTWWNEAWDGFDGLADRGQRRRELLDGSPDPSPGRADRDRAAQHAAAAARRDRESSGPLFGCAAAVAALVGCVLPRRAGSGPASARPRSHSP